MRMRRVLSRLCFLLLLGNTGVFAQLAAVDAVMRKELEALRIPGAAVAVIVEGEPVVLSAYGLANLETGTPMSTESVFELASLTKQFTAAAILLLVEDGRVDLDAPIARYIAPAPPAWSAITVRQLLNHTGGFALGAIPEIAGSPPLRISTAATFEHVSARALQWPPGQQGWYSDVGYFLLGMIIEQASGQTYRDFLQSRIFTPLELTHTSLTDRARVIPGRVATYSLRDGIHVNWRRDWDHELPAFFGIWSTLGDLVKWDTALREDDFLGADARAALWTPGLLGNGQPASVLDHYYGAGFELADLRGRRTAGHGGASGTYFLRFMDEALSVIVLSNLDAASGARHHRRLAQLVAGAVRPALQPPEVLAVVTDPAPEVTERVTLALQDLAAGRAPRGVSQAYQSWWESAFGRRAVFQRQLRGLGSLEFLATDQVAGMPQWESEAIVRLVHYRASVEGNTLNITVGLLADGSIARLDVPFE
jgi:D-alanyl-D-alanine carboxypeptidase